jgi:hypothetical protein
MKCSMFRDKDQVLVRCFTMLDEATLWFPALEWNCYCNDVEIEVCCAYSYDLALDEGVMVRKGKGGW